MRRSRYNRTIMQPAPELIDLLQRYYMASSAGDADFLATYVSPADEAVVIGTDPAEWWSGGEAIIATWGGAWRSRGGLGIRNSAPVAYRSGTVGWALDRAEFVAPNGAIAPFRLTTIYEQTTDGWRMVHAHFSLGVPDDEVFDDVHAAA